MVEVEAGTQIRADGRRYPIGTGPSEAEEFRSTVRVEGPLDDGDAPVWDEDDQTWRAAAPTGGPAGSAWPLTEDVSAGGFSIEDVNLVSGSYSTLWLYDVYPELYLRAGGPGSEFIDLLVYEDHAEIALRGDFGAGQPGPGTAVLMASPAGDYLQLGGAPKLYGVAETPWGANPGLYLGDAEAVTFELISGTADYSGPFSAVSSDAQEGHSATLDLWVYNDSTFDGGATLSVRDYGEIEFSMDPDSFGRDLVMRARQDDDPYIQLGAAPNIYGTAETPWNGNYGVWMDGQGQGSTFELWYGTPDFSGPYSVVAAAASGGIADHSIWYSDGEDFDGGVETQVDPTGAMIDMDVGLGVRLTAPVTGDPSIRLGDAPNLYGTASTPYDGSPGLMISKSSGGASFELWSGDQTLAEDHAVVWTYVASSEGNNSAAVGIRASDREAALRLPSSGDPYLELGDAPNLYGTASTPVGNDPGLFVAPSTAGPMSFELMENSTDPTLGAKALFDLDEDVYFEVSRVGGQGYISLYADEYESAMQLKAPVTRIYPGDLLSFCFPGLSYSAGIDGTDVLTAASDPASTQALANAIRTLLIDFGIAV